MLSPGVLRRAVALALAVLTALPGLALAAGPKPADPEEAVKERLKSADDLLGLLEVQRSREILEELARDPRSKAATKKTRARLFATLGRVRAELGDEAGMAEAFLEAVRIDRSIKLPKSVSPKILEALERAKEILPKEEPGHHEAGHGPKPDAGPGPSRRDGGEPSAGLDASLPDARVERGDARVQGLDAGSALDAGSRGGADAAIALDAGNARDAGPSLDPRDAALARDAANARDAGAEDAAPRPDASAAKDAAIADVGLAPVVSAEPAVKLKPGLRLVIAGAPRALARVQLLAVPTLLPDSATYYARIRRPDERRFMPFLMTRTGTVAILELRLSDPRYEIYLEAKDKNRVIAKAHSADAPLVLEVEPAPSLKDAWAEPDLSPHPSPSLSARTSSSSTVAVTAASTGLSNTQAWLLAGGVLLAALIITGSILIATSGSNPCQAKEGFGCTEIRVLPLIGGD
ncbi:MAG: hypothetical protein U1E65_32695 [Myxococcota bacterium]